jgi:predicted RNA-binding protein with PIN domain
VPYLVDGNNVVGAERRGAASDDGRNALAREIADRLRATQARVVLFFDGRGDSVSLGSLSVRYSGASTADDAIVREVGRALRPQEMIVVTADRELARRTRDAGGRVTSPSEFWKRFGAPTREPRPAAGETRVDVDDWLKWLSDDRNRKE